jgi:hypothetical protein
VHRLKDAENRVLRKIFGLKREEVVRRGMLYNEELHNCTSGIHGIFY